MASDADPAEPLQPMQVPLPDPVAAAGEPATAPDAADAAPVQPQQLIPDDPNPPVLESPPLPPVFLPELLTNSITARPPEPATATGNSSNSPAPSYATFSPIPKTCTAICTGFQIMHSREPERNNTVVLVPARNETTVDPTACGLYEVAKLRLTNGGLLAPTGARMISVPITTKVTIQTPQLNKSSQVTLRFNVMWSLGGPAALNQAGIFAINMRSPNRTADFQLSMSAFTVFNMKIEVVGFMAHPKAASGGSVVVLGDWGQPAPEAEQQGGAVVGPRVYVKPGKIQVVKLMVRICRSDGS